MLTRRRLLGIAMIVFGVLVVVLATVRPNPFKDRTHVVVEFDRVQGIGRIDRNVRVGGANTGEIGKVERKGDDVTVELELEGDVPVRKDARVELRPHTLFEGSAFVDLDLGTPNAPELEEGDQIPKSQTGVYVSLDEATRVLRKGNRLALKDLVGSGSDVLRDEGVAGLQQTLKEGPELTKELGPTARALQGPHGFELAGAIRGLARTSHAVATKEGQLGPLVRNANRTQQALATRGGEALDAALVALPGALEDLDAGDEDFVRLINHVTTLASSLEPASRELAPLLRGTRPLLRRSTPIIRKSTPLISALRTILARTSNAAPALRDGVEALAPGSELLVNSVVPALNKPGYFGLPGYAQLVTSFTGGAATGRSFQTPAQSPNPGHIIRVSGYLDPQGTAGIAIPDCSVVELISKNLADRLKILGLCNA